MGRKEEREVRKAQKREEKELKKLDKEMKKANKAYVKMSKESDAVVETIIDARDVAAKECVKASENYENMANNLQNRVHSVANLNSQNRVYTVPQEEAKRAEVEIKKKEFLETHASVEKFRKEFLHNKMLKETGIISPEPQSPYMKKLEVLRSSKLVSNRYLDKIFLPYLMEKKALGIISNEEQKEFDAILGKTGKIEDLENATTTESYTSDFDNALIILGAIGVIKMKEFAGCKEFPKGKEARDPILRKSDFDLTIEANYLGNNKTADILLDSKDRKYITPEEAAIATLNQVSNSKADQARKVEYSELNLGKGEPKID